MRENLFYEWRKAGILSIKDLLNENGAFLSFQEFSQKYSCRSNFLQLYQVISAIPRHLLIKARNCDQAIVENSNMDNAFQFLLNDNTKLNLDKIKAKEFYWMFINGSSRCHTGPLKWSRSFSVSDNDWQ